MKQVALVWGLCTALAVPSVAGDSDPKLKKPRLDLRVNPRFAFSPVNVLMVAELIGGDDVEEYHCPEVEWDWDDGSKSTHEADCEPFEKGTAIERRYTAEHEYRRAGSYNVRVTMKRTSRLLAQATARLTVRPGLTDPTIDTR